MQRGNKYELELKKVISFTFTNPSLTNLLPLFPAANNLPIIDGFQENTIRDQGFKSKNKPTKKAGSSRKGSGRGRSLSRSRYAIIS